MTTAPAGNKKQKIMIVLTLIIFAVVGWMLFGSSLEGPPPEVLVPEGSKYSPPTKPQGPAPTIPSKAPTLANAPTTTTPSPAAKPTESEQPATQINTAVAGIQQNTEKTYIEQLQQLQQLKLQQEVATMKQALLSAKLATLTTEKNTAELLTPTRPQSPDANAPVINPASVPAYVPPPPPVPTPPPEVVTPYTVLSLTFKGGKWTAVLGNGNKLYSVSVGDTLTPDGSTVISINKNRVILRSKSGKQREISFISTI